MFGLGMGEIVIILIVALLVLGPTQLPEAAKQIGKTIRQLRRHTRDLQETIERDEAIGGTVRELKSALRGDDLGEIMAKTRITEGETPVAQEATPPAEPTALVTPAVPPAPAAPPAAQETPKSSENG